MIPWVREKFAERRVRWLKKRDENITENNSNQFTNKQNTSEIFFKNSTNDKKNSTPADVTEIKPTENEEENSNSSNSSNNELKLRIISPKGRIMSITILKSATGHNLKTEALKRLMTNYPIEILLEKYKIVRAKHKNVFDEKLSLLDLGIRDNDEFIIVLKRSDLLTEVEQLNGPTLEEIETETNNDVTSRITSPTVNIDEMVLNDLQFDIRRILISLAQSSAYVIGAGPYAERLIAMLKQRLINRRRQEADSIQCLSDMGITREKVIHALKLKNNVYAAALDFLIENESSTSLTKLDNIAKFSSLSTKFLNLNSTNENIEALLEIIRIHAQRDVPATSEMIKTIVDMGFPEIDVLEALKATRNNQAAACEWLVGNRDKSLTELKEGCNSESPVLKALLNSPQVQISLGNPKMFIAYISMLENYNAINMWLGDNDTSGILGHILRTYHEEKHIIAINQFSTML